MPKDLKNQNLPKSANRQSYDHRSVEAKWQKKWLESGIYTPDMEKAKNPYYNLWMFPYPSAEGLHVGHAFTATGSDVQGRFRRMNGRTVFQPTGYDSFGIHSENYALKIGVNPADLMAKTTKHYEDQLKSLGEGYDWKRTVTTSDIDYYRWTEWVFIQLFKAGLAYKKKAVVNFCPKDKTVLADEQVMTPKQAQKEPLGADGLPLDPTLITDDLRVCERCGTVAEKRELEQWFFKITDYADRLLSGLDKIDWTEKVKTAQREWIGKSKGLIIDFSLSTNHDSLDTVSVWTKFWETIYGVTFIVVSPEYAKEKLLSIVPDKYAKDVNAYIKVALNKSEQERNAVKEKTGVPMGIYAINPVNGNKVPMFVADYVLAGVGTGAVMGVPAHDERDFEFALKYDLSVIRVVAPKKDFYRSYLMGGKNISDKDLSDVGVKIIGKGKSGRKIEIPKSRISKYEELIKNKLENGFWNEYVGSEIVFLFKNADGEVKKFILNNKNYLEISKLASIYTKGEVSEEKLPWNFLAEVDIYKNSIIHETGGIIENSGKFDGMEAWGEGKEKMADWMVNEGYGHWQTNYHLRDWLISRQRYWGCPIPMIYCAKCAQEGKSWFTTKDAQVKNSATKSVTQLKIKNSIDSTTAGWFPIEEEKLPIELPYINDWKPEGTGKGPLANHPDYYKTTCPNCGADAVREPDVADTFLDSAWYFLRYPSVDAKSNKSLPFDVDLTKKWMPVDLYFGGAEHAVLHLMYSRFVTMVLHDQGHLNFEEPFPRFYAHGLMIKDGAKMSKSRGNVVNPDEYITKFGADTLRLYLMFMGPMDGYPDFRDTGIEGMEKFVNRLWDVFGSLNNAGKEDKDITIKMHQTIKKVTKDIQEIKYNTAISAIMEFVNLIKEKGNYSPIYLENLVKLIAPFAPHLAEEVWSSLAEASKDKQKKSDFDSIHLQPWPVYDEKLLVTDTKKIIIQVNGKVRGTFEANDDTSGNKEKVIAEAKKIESVAKWLEGNNLINEIFVPGKLINFVVK